MIAPRETPTAHGAPTAVASSAPDPFPSAAVAPVSLPRLRLLQAGYLFIGVGLAVTTWPSFLPGARPWPLMEGVVTSMLTAMSVLALLGVRHPLRMLPLLLFESLWKLIWLAVVALPLWVTGRMDQATSEVAFACSFLVVVLVVVPWRHVFLDVVPWRRDTAYRGTGRGEGWRSDAARPTGGPLRSRDAQTPPPTPTQEAPSWR